MKLHYLDFDFSEDVQGHGSFEAMASVLTSRLPELESEVLQVLAWAHREAPGERGALEEGGQWDYLLHAVHEVATPLDVRYEPGAGDLGWRAGLAGAPRVTLSLTLTGTPAFCTAFRQSFNLD